MWCAERAVQGGVVVQPVDATTHPTRVDVLPAVAVERLGLRSDRSRDHGFAGARWADQQERVATALDRTTDPCGPALHEGSMLSATYCRRVADSALHVQSSYASSPRLALWGGGGGGAGYSSSSSSAAIWMGCSPQCQA